VIVPLTNFFLFGALGQTVFMLLLGFVALFLILLVLVQRGRGGGLAGALGGMGGSSAFGAKAGDVFTKITVVVATLWILLCIAGSKLPQSGKSLLNTNVSTTASSPEVGSALGAPVEGARAEASKEGLATPAESTSSSTGSSSTDSSSTGAAASAEESTESSASDASAATQ